MKYPSFIAEMGLPANRKRLWFSVKSGYVLVLAFGALGALAHVTRVIEFYPSFYVLLGLKLLTNTGALVALRKDTLVLELAGLNVLTDCLTMTGLIYYTGGEVSPGFPIYVIELSVVALLSNLGVTVLVAGGSIALYAAMAILVHAGVLPAMPPPIAMSGGITDAYVAFDLVYVVFVLGVPTFFTARILRELRAKQEALEARTQALIEAGKQKSQFMANITHELRTPIQGICGLSDLIDSGIYGPVTTKQREAQQGIKRSAKSLLQLIDDLLELSRADAGRLAFKPEWVDVAEVVPTVVSAVRWMQGTKDLKIETTLEDDLSRIFTDARKLNQVLLNLLSNAVKFTPDGGRIAVRVRRSGEALTFEVTDSGIGIPPEEQARIFEEFRQVDGSAERAFGGIGLGLALVKRLAALLGGEVSVTSAVGEGSTFAFVLPIAPSTAQHEERAA